ncbi:hypothetical protein [Thauera butanivorans]|uniref:hypothetical protein n=1 Tax=Thauera butanivorans TaxID=86174 RepID=UPI000837ED6A|nr:hypothetical protein [Thauera butanivorans]
MVANAALDSLLNRLTAALGEQIRPGIGLFDPADDKPSPADHYGQLYAALALACRSENDWAVGRKALQAWLALDAKRLGHLPFNRLALLLLRIVLAGRGLTASDEAMIEAGLARCRLRRRYPSNNWSLLAQTCRLIEAPAHRKALESRRLCKLLERWTTTKGGFIDFPAKPREHFSTPLAYHHKALYLTALACWFHDDAELAHHACRMLDWLVHCWDPAGYAGGFGRTTHGLFGDGCLIASLILMGSEDDVWQQPIAALCDRLEAQHRPDGLLWLTPAGPRSGTASWDGYMHLSVYNAWAAAIIAAARTLKDRRARPTPLCDTRWTAARTGLFHDEEAGLAYLRTEDGLNALVSTRGQPPQAYSRNEADFRYAGGVLIHLRLRDGPPLAAPPVRTARKALTTSPVLAGWTPLLKVRDTIYAIDSFERVAISESAAMTTIALMGQPNELFRPTPGTPWQRALATLDWRILGGALGRKTALRRRKLERLTAHLEINFSRTGLAIAVNLDLDNGVLDDVVYLNPLGHTTGKALTEWITAGPGEAGEHSSIWIDSLPPSSLSELPARALAPQVLAQGRSTWMFQLKRGDPPSSISALQATAAP